MTPDQGQITELLNRWSQGDKRALDEVMPLVYQDLRRLSQYYLQDERPGHTLQSTALVHEVYLRLCGQQESEWTGRAHFFAVAAKMIRRILVDHARQKSAAKRGGKVHPQPLEEALTIPVQPEVDLVTLNEAMEELAAFDLRKSQVVEMRFFAGLAARDIATVLRVTEPTVRRDWNIARAWLYRRLQGERQP